MAKALEANFPPLYKRTVNGEIQEWHISVEEGTTIVTVFGRVGSKNLQEIRETIEKGKNIGRANETTASEQAFLEAKARWTKKLKSGYNKSLKGAKSGLPDEKAIRGGITPMLAHVFDPKRLEHGETIAVQPKLDGARMICVINKNGVPSFWTRTRKEVKSVEHIFKEMYRLSTKFGWKDMILDGEAFNPDYNDDFNTLMSAFRREKSSEESKLLQYHVYDVVGEDDYPERTSGIMLELDSEGSKIIQPVATVYGSGAAFIDRHYRHFLELGYEGAIVRRLYSGYENKRTFQLMKIKPQLDAEFRIVDVEEGRGKLAGKAGAFVCVTRENKRFTAKLMGSLKDLTEYLVNKEKYIGKNLTVRFQDYTPAGVPRFPRGVRIRDEE